ncbi:MAG: hypothetical protein WCT28_03140 [Patescibacteria group bacterium]|jgi:hypothetical protein
MIFGRSLLDWRHNISEVWEMEPSKNEGNLASELLPRTPNSRAWKIYANSGLLSVLLRRQITSLVIVARTNSGDELGRLEYGEQPGKDGEPSGYDTFQFLENGGSVTLLYAIVNGQLLIGLVRQFRSCERNPQYNPDGFVPNSPRGFHNPHCEPGLTAAEEISEEVGPLTGEIARLSGANLNCNNAWITYRDERRDGESVAQGGVTIYALRVDEGQMELDSETGGWRVSSVVRSKRPKGSPYEVIDACTFVPWTEAIQTRDVFTSAGVARLLALLVANKKVTVTF